LSGGFKIAKDAITILQKKIIPKNLILCEPSLSKKKLYPAISKKNNKDLKLGREILDFLQYADGKNELKEISKIIHLDFKKTLKICQILKKNKIISI